MQYPFIIISDDLRSGPIVGLAVKRGAKSDAVVAYMDYAYELRIQDLMMTWAPAPASYGNVTHFVTRVLRQKRQGMKIPESAVARLSGYSEAELSAADLNCARPDETGELEMAKAKKAVAEGAAAPKKASKKGAKPAAAAKKAAPAAKKAAPWDGTERRKADAAPGGKKAPDDKMYKVVASDKPRRGVTAEFVAAAEKLGTFTRPQLAAVMEKKGHDPAAVKVKIGDCVYFKVFEPA